MTWRVGVLGATGAVGQKMIQGLSDHPWFRITEVAASERSAGKSYAEAVRWMQNSAIPPGVADLEVKPVQPGLECDFVLSALDSSVAGPVEEEFARAGYPVISNCRNHRMDEDVPLVIPEVNPISISSPGRRSGADSPPAISSPIPIVRRSVSLSP